MPTLKRLPMLKNIKLICYVVLIASSFLYCSKDSSGNFAGGAPSGQGGSLARFAIVNNYMYAVDKENLGVFSISNPANPQLLRTIKVGFEIETIFPFKDKLFIGSTSVVHIFSIADPAKPEKLSQAISPTVLRRCDPVVAKDNVAYATLRSNGPCGGGGSALVVYNITNVSNPRLEKTISLSGPYGLGVKNNYLYVCEGSGGIKVFNITNPYDPVAASTLIAANTIFYDVIPYGNILIAQVNDGFILYDIGTNPQQPAFLSRIMN